MLAECLQLQEKFFDAADLYEGLKRELEALVLFEDSLLYIHVCNQIGNCFYKLGDLDRALDHL